MVIINVNMHQHFSGSVYPKIIVKVDVDSTSNATKCELRKQQVLKQTHLQKQMIW